MEIELQSELCDFLFGLEGEQLKCEMCAQNSIGAHFVVFVCSFVLWWIFFIVAFGLVLSLFNCISMNTLFGCCQRKFEQTIKRKRKSAKAYILGIQSARFTKSQHLWDADTAKM